jgi:uncharacterized protein DUF4396
MHGSMAVAYSSFFGSVIGTQLKTDTVEFCFTMQIVMLFGFATSYPVNWWLILSDIKEDVRYRKRWR